MTADEFARAASWEAGRASEWAERLDQRAAGPAQTRLRHRMCEATQVGAGHTVVELAAGPGTCSRNWPA